MPMRKSRFTCAPECFATSMTLQHSAGLPALQSGEGSKLNAIIGNASRREGAVPHCSRLSVSNFGGFQWCERGDLNPHEVAFTRS